MRTILFLLSIIVCSSIYAGDLTVNVLEGWKSTPLADAILILETKSGKTIRTGKTNSKGVAIFEGVSKGNYRVVAKSPGTGFENGYTWIKIKTDTRVTMIVYPTKEYEESQIAREDSIYGLVGQDEILPEDSDSIARFAEFSGGDHEMSKFIQENVVYPELSRELGDQGRIYIKFVVEPDGVITHVEIMRGSTPELDREGKRLVRAMPRWTPAMVNGKTVRAICRLPITFTLQ